MAEVQDVLARLSLFADLPPAQLEAIAHRFDEEVFPEGERVLRKNLKGSGLFVILDGEAAVRIGDQEVTRFGPGDFFGEISLLTSETPNADIVALSMLRCLVVPGPEFEPFLLEYPRVLFRILQAEARRLRDTTSWRIGS
ncbi:MAG TPA: cyclic nucleotide-binding domain-containing protein [Gaiellaceae bacterium]|nr:cyclic nucleotide-binding domain-containing protein [Gaiellaceae bacterium]